MDTNTIRKSTPKVSTEVESASRPGLYHTVTLGPESCSCEATVPVCRHIRQARIRTAKGEITPAPCACIGGYVFVGHLEEGDVERVASYRCRRCAGVDY